MQGICLKVTVDPAMPCFRQSNIIFVLMSIFPVSVYSYLWHEVFGEILVEILLVVIYRTLELATKVRPADVLDFPFVCRRRPRRLLPLSSKKYSVSILVIHEVAVPPLKSLANLELN